MKMPMPKMKKSKMSKMKPLSSLKNKARGEMHHMEIMPAKNSDGSQAFLTRIHRNRTPAAQAAMDAGGPYTPMPEPEETQHPDGEDMVNHVCNTCGIKPMGAMAGDDESDDSGAGQGA